MQKSEQQATRSVKKATGGNSVNERNTGNKFSEIGRLGQFRYGHGLGSGIFYEEFERKLLGRRGVEIFKEMSEKRRFAGLRKAWSGILSRSFVPCAGGFHELMSFCITQPPFRHNKTAYSRKRLACIKL
jgi:hypothetical protein